jgi:hypothetical protein
MNANLIGMELRVTAQMIRDTFARVPDPALYADMIPLEVAEILTGAWLSVGGRRVTEEGAQKIRTYGLCEFGGPYLTVFGSRVRAAVVASLLP